MLALVEPPKYFNATLSGASSNFLPSMHPIMAKDVQRFCRKFCWGNRTTSLTHFKNK